MDNLKHSNNNQSLIGFFQFYNPKKAIKVLLSFSVFSLSIYIFSFFMQVLMYSFDKNCMFLVCNGLLVFIFKSSGLRGNSSAAGSTINSDGHATEIDNIQKTEVALTQSTKPLYAVEQVVMEVDDEEEQRRENGQLVTVKEEEKELFVTSADRKEKELQRIELLSTEELNKKCEEFIKKMRKGINSEARQPVVMECAVSAT